MDNLPEIIAGLRAGWENRKQDTIIIKEEEQMTRKLQHEGVLDWKV